MTCITRCGCPIVSSARPQEEPVRRGVDIREPVGNNGGTRISGDAPRFSQPLVPRTSGVHLHLKTDRFLWSQAFAAALVAFAGLYLRHRFTINPRAVYRQAMVKLNTSPSVLEVRHSAPTARVHYEQAPHGWAGYRGQ